MLGLGIEVGIRVNLKYKTLRILGYTFGRYALPTVAFKNGVVRTLRMSCISPSPSIVASTKLPSQRRERAWTLWSRPVDLRGPLEGNF